MYFSYCLPPASLEAQRAQRQKHFSFAVDPVHRRNRYPGKGKQLNFYGDSIASEKRRLFLFPQNNEDLYFPPSQRKAKNPLCVLCVSAVRSKSFSLLPSWHGKNRLAGGAIFWIDNFEFAFLNLHNHVTVVTRIALLVKHEMFHG